MVSPPGDAAGYLYDYLAAGAFPRANVLLRSPLVIDAKGLFPAGYAREGRKLLAEIGDEIRVGNAVIFLIEPLWKCRVIMNARFSEWGLSEDQKENWK